MAKKCSKSQLMFGSSQDKGAWLLSEEPKCFLCWGVLVTREQLFKHSEKKSVPSHCCHPALSRWECEGTGSWPVSRDWCFISVAPLLQARLYEQAVFCTEQTVWVGLILIVSFPGETLHPGCIWQCYQEVATSTTLSHCHFHQTKIHRSSHVSITTPAVASPG